MRWKGQRKSSNVEDRRGQSSMGRGMGGINPLLIGPLLRFLFSKKGLLILLDYFLYLRTKTCLLNQNLATHCSY